LESLDARLPVARLPIEVLVGRPGVVEPGAHEIEKRRELREDERLGPLGHNLVECRGERVDFCTGNVRLPWVGERRVTRRLTQAE
jgi:hypothetical protein